MGFVSYMILVWDHIATFDDEVLLPNVGRSRMLLTLSGVQVEYIWKGKKGPRKRIMGDLLFWTTLTISNMQLYGYLVS